jgi:Putative translation initiation inhibitor, yjgF family
MKITRSLGSNRYHEVVVYGDLVYLAGVVSEKQGIAAQVGDVLKRIEELLAHAGSDKDHILRTTIYLKTMDDFEVMNEIWETWINKAHAPTRATVETRLADENILIEVVIDAVKTGAE